LKAFSTEEIRNLIAAGEPERFYKSRYWRELSRQIIAENHNECYMCREAHKVARAVLVHHVKPLRDHPELAYSKTYTDSDGEHVQLMPLCFNCHEKIHERGAYSKPSGYQNIEKW